MRGGKTGKSDTNHLVPPVVGWPPWARRLASAALLLHFAAVLTGALAAPPSSPLERSAAERFAWYHRIFDQGYGYRYYAPEPGPTPVVTATIRYDDGRPEETVRLPERGVKPRLRYQRQLALANHLVSDFETARRIGGGGVESVYARSYARHLARTHPGSASVTLYSRLHLIPDPRLVQESIREGRPVDLDAEEFYTAPERIGEFPCDAF